MSDIIFFLLSVSGLLTGAVLIAMVKDLRLETSHWFMPAIAGGVAIGVLAALPPMRERSWSIAVVIAVVSFILRSRRDSADLTEGLLSGVTAGSIAGTIVWLDVDDPHAATLLLICTLVATMLQFATPVRSRRARFAIAVAVALILIFARAPLAELLRRTDRTAFSFAGAAGLVLALLSLFLRWPIVRRELREESRLGFIPAGEINGASNPLQRVRRLRWADLSARREFVRLATALAIQKSRQRSMPPAQARLYQLEVIRIRMLIQDVYAVELSMRNSPHIEADAESQRSDKLEAKG